MPYLTSPPELALSWTAPAEVAASPEEPVQVRNTTPLVLLAAARICEAQLVELPENPFTEGPVRMVVERVMAAAQAVEDGEVKEAVIEGPIGYEPMYLRRGNVGLAKQQMKDLVGIEFPDLFYPGSTSPVDFLAIDDERPINADVPRQLA